MAKKAAVETKKSTNKAVIGVAELRKQSVAELGESLKTARKDLAEAKRGLVAGELINPRVIGSYRKTIARVQTLINEKKRAEASEGKEDK